MVPTSDSCKVFVLVSNSVTVSCSHFVLNIHRLFKVIACIFSYSLCGGANGRGKQNKELVYTLETTYSFSEVSRTWHY